MNDDDISHYGVKGMKWGVRKEEELVGRKSKASPLSSFDKKVLDAAGVSLADSPALKSKYGPGTLSKDPPSMEEEARRRGLSPAQKKLLVVGGGAALAIGGLYLLGKYGDKQGLVGAGGRDAFHLPGAPLNQKSQQSLKTFFEAYATREATWSPDSLSDTPLHFPAGSIVKRISTELETSIRPGGFYAAFSDSDVERYKAVLPVFWKQWGMPRSSGFVVHLRAKQDVSAPSPKRAYDMFQTMMKSVSDDEIGFPMSYHRAGDSNSFFQMAALNWNNENDPLTKRFFSLLRSEGYNAVPDLNDVGKLAQIPMRFIDGTLFEIAHNEILSADAILAAQEKLTGILHALLSGGLTMDDVDRAAALAHFGVKGMKWGQRKEGPRVGTGQAYANRQRKQTGAIRRVAGGTGSGLDKAKAAGNLGLVNIARGGGLQSAAQKHVDKQEAYLNRLATGNATAKDILTKYATISMYDIVKGRKRVS